uniref:hypothetical protein n=1 Tax=Xenorhabdus bovienii TaxID=40576 RepID=UPI001EE115CE
FLNRMPLVRRNRPKFCYFSGGAGFRMTEIPEYRQSPGAVFVPLSGALGKAALIGHDSKALT